MGLTPSDLLTVTLVVTFAVALGAAVYFACSAGTRRGRRGCASRLAPLPARGDVLAVRPVVRNLSLVSRQPASRSARSRSCQRSPGRLASHCRRRSSR
jgi:hypothetical protein